MMRRDMIKEKPAPVTSGDYSSDIEEQARKYLIEHGEDPDAPAGPFSTDTKLQQEINRRRK